VKERTIYASSFGAARDALGFKLFSKIKRYSLPSEFSWIQFQNSESEKLEGGSSRGGGVKSTNNPPRTGGAGLSSSAPVPEPTPVVEEAKPWSQRELLLQQLEREEEIARKEYEQKAVAVIALAKVAFPLSDPVTEAVNQLQEGVHNWIQIKLNNPPTQFELVESKNISDHELESSVDPRNPQFYLYSSNNYLTVIYCCPEQVKGEGSFAQARQNRMVYATAKSSLIESISNMNLSLNLKKYDITEPSELSGSSFSSHIQSKASDIKNAKQLQGSRNYNDNGGYRTGGRVAGNPVFGPGQPVSLASVMVNNNSRKPLPKGVVLPPKGAHC
jgi:hypothetical protein